jgi:hypothetical protein
MEAGHLFLMETQPASYCHAGKKGIVQRWLRLTTEYEFETRAITIVHVFDTRCFISCGGKSRYLGMNCQNEAD